MEVYEMTYVWTMVTFSLFYAVLSLPAIRCRKLFHGTEKTSFQKKIHTARMLLYASIPLFLLSLFLLFFENRQLALLAAGIEFVSLFFVGKAGAAVCEIREDEEHRKRSKPKMWWEKENSKNEKPE